MYMKVRGEDRNAAGAHFEFDTGQGYNKDPYLQGADSGGGKGIRTSGRINYMMKSSGCIS